MKVSIIVPVYNAKENLPALLASFQNQTYQDLEIILVDNNSSDGSYELLTEASKQDHRFMILQERQQGPNFARKTGFLHATGNYVYFCDADDILKEGAIASFVACIKKTQADVVIGNYDEINDQKEVTKHCKGVFYKDTSGNLKRYPDLIHVKPALWIKIFKRDLIPEDAFINSKIGEDMVISLLAMARAKTVCYIDEIIYQYVPADTGLSNSLNPKNLLDIRVSCDALKRLFKKYDCFKEYQDELDFLIFTHIIYRILRSLLLVDQEQREEVYRLLLLDLKKIPYKKNRYYKKKVHYRIANFVLATPSIYHWRLTSWGIQFMFHNKTLYKLFKVLDK